ncbi:MAG TPA: tryptophan 7-halogenase [Steroidobacteraceae bacterium]|nr:tryptophan 7-halogenase [Steroidobacteraceae bacterium]
MSTTVKQVVIVGGDSQAWLAACALKRALAHRDTGIRVVNPGASSDALRAHWTLPSLRRLHSLVGIKESNLVATTGGTFKLGVEHTSWHGDGSSFIHAHGEIGTSINGVPFYKWLVMQRLAGHSVRPETYSLAAVAAKAQRFAQPMDTNALTSSFTYALHLDERAYSTYLRNHALSLGVTERSGDISEIERDAQGRLLAVVLSQGEQIAADYFLDCSGPRGILINRLDPEFDDWSTALPNDRILSGIAAADEKMCALTTTRAIDGGWCWRVPMQQHSKVGVVFDSTRVNETVAQSALQNWLGESVNEFELATLRAGRRRRVWMNNCVAIGSAAAVLEPLVGSPLHIAQLGISTFIELFPLDSKSDIESREYNLVLSEHLDSLRDFTLAHYLISLRFGTGRSGAVSERLTDRLDLFKSNARIETFDHETFEEVDWAWLLLGGQCWPEMMELHARANLSEADRLEQFDAMKAAIERLASSMPMHRDYVRQLR